MTALGKALFSLLLVGAGFGIASVFGPPDLADKLAERLTPGGPAPWGDLQPADPGQTSDAVFAQAEVDRLGVFASPLQPVNEAPRFTPTPSAAAWPTLEAPPQLEIAASETAPSNVAPVAYNDWPNWPQGGTAPTGFATNPAPSSPTPINPTTSNQPTARMVPVRDQAVQPAIANSWQPANTAPAAPSPPAWGATQPAVQDHGWGNWQPTLAPATGQPVTSTPAMDPTATGQDVNWQAAPGAMPASQRPAPAIGAWQSAVQQEVGAQPTTQQPMTQQPATPPQDAWPTATPSLAAKPVSTRAWPAPDPVATAAPTPRTHIVADGDTLEQIASRYLGDPSKSAELFALNRGVLSHPDLLPIGVEIVLGPGAATPQGAFATQPAIVSQPVTASQPFTATQPAMTPVAEPPRMAPTAPRARLLAPQPAGPVDAYAGW